MVINFTVTAQWSQTNGPDNANVGGIYIKDSVIYAATYDYVYRSTDKGETWGQIKNGFNYDMVDCITGKGSYLFAGTTYSGLYGSSNLGASWTTIRGIITTNFISGFAWNDSTLFVSGVDGVYRSTDMGKTWTKPYDADARVLSVFAEDSLVVAGMNKSGIRISVDSGKNWSLGSSLLSKRSVYSFISTDSVVYAGTDSGMYSRNWITGEWSFVDSSLSKFKINAFIRYGKSILAATNRGIIRTNDGWKSWDNILSRGRILNILSIGVTGPEIYAGTASRGIYRSLDSGKTWSLTGAVNKKMYINSVSVQDSLLLVGGEYGIFLSTNEGARWTDITADSVDYIADTAIEDSVLYAGTPVGLFRRGFQESQWTSLLIGEMVHAVKVNGDSIYIATHNGIWFSPDLGKTYKQLDSSFRGIPIYAIGAFGQTLFVGSGVGIYRSNDHGKQWRLCNTSPDNIWASDFVQSDTFYYASTMYGVGRMGEHDSAWTVFATGLGSNQDVASICIAGKYIFLGLRGGGIAYSTNRGVSWISASNTTIRFYNVFGVGVNSRKIFFGGAYTGIWTGILHSWVNGVPTSEVPSVSDFGLPQNYPNPFNPSTTIEYRLEGRVNVVVSVYNILGQHITTLVNGIQDPGVHSVTFNAAPFAAGLYFYELRAGNIVSVKRMILVK